MRDEELERLIREASSATPVPEFERVWRSARREVGTRRAGGAWQWVLGPALAAVAATVLIVAVGGVPEREGPRAPAARDSREEDASLVAVADAGAGASTARAESWDKAEPKPAAEGLYVAGTDFLLELEIPAWN
jgi:hypothetical protein